MTLQNDTKPRATTSTDDATMRITTLRHRPNSARKKRDARRDRVERRLREPPAPAVGRRGGNIKISI